MFKRFVTKTVQAVQMIKYVCKFYYNIGKLYYAACKVSRNQSADIINLFS